MRIIITEKQISMLENSYVETKEPTKYTYSGIGVFRKGNTAKYYFNDVKPISDTNPVNDKIKIEGPSGNFLLNKNKLVFNKTFNSIGVDIQEFEREYPNGLVKNKSKISGINSKTVKEALMKSFPENWNEETNEFSAGLRGIYTIGDKLNNDEDWSVMNYFDTKQEIHDLLSMKYGEEGSDENVVDWMVNLFKNNKSFLEMLVNRQWKSIESGLKLERDTVSNFINKTNAKNIKYHPHGSKMDRYHGIDVSIDGVNYQIKPLRGIKFNEEDKEFYISTYGMRDYESKKLVNKIAFANDKMVAIFNNKNYNVVSKDTVIFFEKPEILK